MQRMLAVATDPEVATRRALTAALFTEYEESDRERWRLLIAEPAFRWSYAPLRALGDTINLLVQRPRADGLGRRLDKLPRVGYTDLDKLATDELTLPGRLLA
jgi:hypothetical protein